MVLVFDTETTGKLDFNAEPDAAHQPRLVQLGAILYGEDARVLAQVDMLVKPDGYSIPAEASSIHGITQAMATDAGLPLTDVLSVFHHLASTAHVLVAYNADFDTKIMTGEYLREFLLPPFDPHHKWSDPMHEMTPICKLPGRRGYKWPKLSEAYRCLFDREMTDAHNALGDVKATADIYWHLHPPTK